jgi:hypothetical protein
MSSWFIIGQPPAASRQPTACPIFASRQPTACPIFASQPTASP